MVTYIAQQLVKNMERKQSKDITRTKLTAMVKILMTPSTALPSFVFPEMNCTLPSGFFVLPVKYLQAFSEIVIH